MLAYHIFTLIIATVVTILIGSLWYSPLMFGKQWMHMMGFTAEHMEKAKQKRMAPTYAWAFVFSLVHVFLVYILFLSGFELVGVFAIWVGFSLPIFSNAVLWEGKPWKFFFIQAGCSLVSTAFVFEILRIFLLSVWG